MSKPTYDIWEKAKELHLADNFAEAEILYVKLLEQNHDNPGLLSTLGSLYYQAERYGLAVHFLEAAIPKFDEVSKIKCPADVYTNLGLAYKTCNQPAKAREWFLKSIEEYPTAESLTNYAAMFIECGEDDKLTQLCEQAIE